MISFYKNPVALQRLARIGSRTSAPSNSSRTTATWNTTANSAAEHVDVTKPEIRVSYLLFLQIFDNDGISDFEESS